MEWAHGHHGPARSLHLGDFGGQLYKIRAFADPLNIFTGICHEASVPAPPDRLPIEAQEHPETKKKGSPEGGREWASLLFHFWGINPPDLAPLAKAASAVESRDLNRL